VVGHASLPGPDGGRRPGLAADRGAEPAHFRWRTDIRFDYRIRPPLLRSELIDDIELGSFRPFRGFQGSNVPVPPDVAVVLAARAAPRLDPWPRGNG
jgi:hypothetical protein